MNTISLTSGPVVGRRAASRRWRGDLETLEPRVMLSGAGLIDPIAVAAAPVVGAVPAASPAAGVIEGVKWNDLNGDGVFDAGEPALAGWTIFIDEDGDGELDGAEQSRVTDADGAYSFTGLAPGTYTVAEQPFAGWEQTYPAATFVNVWQEAGPAPILSGQTPGGENVSGRLVAIAPDPSDPNTIYIAGAAGGAWKTTDAGASWTPLTDDQVTLAMGAVAVSPSNPNVIYVGTGEAHNSGDSMYGRGVLKSVDGGATWTLLGAAQFNRRAVSKVVVDPTDPDIVYVAVSRAAVNGLGGNMGVWKSIDGGATWANTTAGISSSTGVSDLVMDPTNPNVLIAGYGEIYGASANGLYKTIDGGATWGAIGAGTLPAGSTAGRVNLAISADGQTVYGSWTKVSSTFGSLLGFFQSIDGGATWTNRTGTTPNFLGSQGWYDQVLAVDPANASRVYAGGAAGGNSLIRSDNGGASWADISTGVDFIGPHVDFHSMGFDADGNFLIGSDGGLWRTTDMGAHWDDLNTNLGITQFYDIVLHPTDPDIAYGGTQDNGTAKYLGTLDWDHVIGGDGGVTQIDFNNPNTVYAETQNIGLRRSDNGGLSFSLKTNGINGSDSVRFIAPYEMDPADPTHLVFGTNKVYETTNRGDNWTAISGALDSGVIVAMDIAPSDPDTIYVSYSNGNVWVTFNGGGMWQQRDAGLPAPPPGEVYSVGNYGELDGPELVPQGLPNVVGVGDFAIDPTDNLTAYLVRDQFGRGKVWRTTDGGASWTDISGNLPDVPAQAIVMDARTAPDTIYISTDAGVYASSNLGLSWTPFGTGLPNSIGNDLEINTALDVLAVGTHGRGMWTVSLIATSIAGVHTITLDADQTATDVNFGNHPAPAGTAQIRGRKWNDLNGDGVFDADEPGLAGWTIYLDQDGDQQFDPGEFSTVTAPASGAALDQFQDSVDFAFNFDPDTVRWQQFVPTAGAITQASIFMARSGNPGDMWVAIERESTGEQVWSQLIPQAQTPESGWLDVSIGSPPNVVPGQTYKLLVWGDPISHSPDGLYTWSGQTDVDSYPPGESDVSMSGQSPGYDHAFRVYAPVTPAGAYQFADLAADTYTVGEVLQAGWMQTFPDAAQNGEHTLALADDEVRADVDFANVALDPYDFGDAPGPFPTLDVDGGARHLIVSGGPTLGTMIDADLDGQPSPDALGDDSDTDGDDEDGVNFIDPLAPGAQAFIEVTVAVASGLLSAWVDFDHNGDWSGPGEQVLADAPVDAGTHMLLVDVPAGATPGMTYARFRLSTQSGLTFTGSAADGEVEDYQLDVVAPDTDPPQVAEVLASGTGWTSGGAFNFVQYLADNGLGVGGFAVPTGADQFTTLPWINADQIILRFSEEVTNLAGNVEVRGANGPDGAPGTGDETYMLDLVSSGAVPAGGSGAFQAIYQLAAGAFVADKLLIDVSDAVTDVAGNALDGEWVNGTSTFNSGDSVAGGAFQFRVNVLPGDVVAPAFVLSTDVNNVIARAGSSTLAPALYSPKADVDGNGIITSLDVNGVIGRAGTTLPGLEPTGPANTPPGAPLPGVPGAGAALLFQPAASPASTSFNAFVQLDPAVRYTWLDGDV